MKTEQIPEYTQREEHVHGLTHGVGLVLSVVGLVVMILLAVQRGTVWHVVSFSLYGASLVLLFLSSMLYHSVQRPRAKEVLQRLDHSAIFVLIAGTYTPFLLVNLRGAWGWSLFGVIWFLCVTGILGEVFARRHMKYVSLPVYLGMGWLVIIALGPALRNVAIGGILWLVAGGLCYTVGVGFYAWRRRLYTHAVWHLFVLAGSVCHYVSVLGYVLPHR